MRNVLLALAIWLVALTASQPTFAQTIYLKCSANNIPDDIYTIDLAKQTVNNLPASITATSIDWHNENQTGDNHIVIDRTTGNRIFDVLYHTRQGDKRFRDDAGICTSVSAPQTKF
jgi:hypothetical protein